MQISEREFEDYIFDELTENNGDLFHDNHIFLPTLNTGNKSVWRRQVNLNPYGIADIIGISREYGCLYVDIIELKVTPSELDHFDQLGRYKTGVREILKRSGFTGSININCYLFVTDLEKGAYLQNICGVNVVQFKYGLRGFSFEFTGQFSNWYMLAQDKLEYDYKNFFYNGRLQKN